MATAIRAGLQRLYFGTSQAAQAFQFFSIIFEIGLMVYFVGTSFLPHTGWIITLDLGIAALLFIDFLIRWWITERPGAYFRKVSTWTDLIVIITMVLPALFAHNLLFMRAIRAIRIFRSYHLLNELYEHYAFIRTKRDAIEASVNLMIFIFVMSLFLLAALYYNPLDSLIGVLLTLIGIPVYLGLRRRPSA